MAKDRLDCIHHWVINWQNVGTCIKCGDRRDFAHIQTQIRQEANAARTAAANRSREANHNS